MKQLKVGIIGQGRSGRDIHGKCLINMPEKYKIVAVTDAIEERRERAKAEYGCNVYADYHDMIAALRETGYQGDMTLEIRGFLSRYADYGLLMPALQFSAAIGRKLIEMMQQPT